MHNTLYGDGWGKIMFGMLFFPQRIGKYSATLRWKRFWLLVGWQIRGRLHFDIYNVFLPQFSVGCSPYGWLRRPPWGPDTAGPISQAVISRPPSKSWKLTNPPSHNSPLALICTTSMYSTHIFSKSIISPFWPDHSYSFGLNSRLLWTYSSSRPPFLCSPMFPLPALVSVQVCSLVSACRGISQLHPQIPSQSLIKHIIQHNTELTFCIIRSLCIILCTLIIWRKPAVERRPGSSLKANHPTHQYHHQHLDL